MTLLLAFLLAITLAAAAGLLKCRATLVAQNADLRQALTDCVTILTRVDTSEGVCMCGDSMGAHSSPMSCGHSPVDAGDYYAANVLAAAHDVLEEPLA